MTDRQDPTRPAEERQIVDHLAALGDTEIAAHSQRFFKTGRGEYGEGDRFLGIRVPRVREAVKQFRHANLSTASTLLQSPWHKVRLLALLMLVDRYTRHPEEQESIYRLYLGNTAHINNWDLVDSSAPRIAGAWLLERDRDILRELARSRSLWERRIAIMASFRFIHENQFDDTLELAGLLLRDPHDLIHKAVGWMLREIGRRDLEVACDFLNASYRRMPRTMLRYAIEKLDEPLRQRYLQGQI